MDFTLLLLPNQLFDDKYLPKYEFNKIVLYEHPYYFTKYKFNKKKLILHRASMKYYFNNLQKKYNVEYIEFNKKYEPKNYINFDFIDNIKFKNKSKKVFESPNFLLTKIDYEKYRKKTDKFVFNAFYMFGKKIIDIIPNVKSQDKQNREKIPKNQKIPNIPNNNGTNTNQYITEAKSYIEKNFKSNYGNIDNFVFPIDRITAKKWLDKFLEEKMNKFGPYQDFIIKDENYLFHSCLSSSINIGLINPLEIIEILKTKKSSFPLNSYEGYIRQLFWREYQRYTFIYCDFSTNYFGNSKKLNKKWYEGKLDIEPVDDAIKIGFDTGYLHHINRLMVIGNFMNLYGLNPKEGLKWFMEFSVDSYEWVMYQNVLDMVFFVTGGKTMRKPYVSSSNYVLKMSNYKKGEWSKKWDELYTNFQKKNLDKLWKFRYSFPNLKKFKTD